MPGPDLLARIDRAIAELQAIRAAVAGAEAADEKDRGDNITPIADDLGDLIDSHSASARFGYPTDTIRLWARRGDGRKVGGRWMIDPAKLRKRINGG